MMSRDGKPGNLWLGHRAGEPWPLAVDLSRRGSPQERRIGMAILGALLVSLVLIVFISPPLTGWTETSLERDHDSPDSQLARLPSGDTNTSVEGAAENVAIASIAGPALAGAHPITAPDEPAQIEIAIRRGDTLIDALLAAGVDQGDAYAAVTALRKVHDPRRLRVGQQILLEMQPDQSPSLERLSIRTGASARVAALRLPEGGFEARTEPLQTSELVAYAEGSIDDSLYVAANRAGVPAGVIVEMIRLFSFNVDFQREIRPGDRFALLYRRILTEEDGEIENSDILFARLTLSGRDIALYRHKPIDDDRTDYFDGEGRTARKTLMKTPLDGARLTSRYGSRKHPVLGYVRAHRGLDFGAPTGTPVFAAGDGVIERSSRYGAYGNYVRIRHNDTYKTAYAHLSKYGAGIRQGVRVRQGQIIGYVGATGRVTGPHLHYEVLVNDEQVDPLRLKLPSGRILADAARDAFDQDRAALDADIDVLARANALVMAANRADAGGPEASSTAP